MVTYEVYPKQQEGLKVQIRMPGTHQKACFTNHFMQRMTDSQRLELMAEASRAQQKSKLHHTEPCWLVGRHRCIP